MPVKWTTDKYNYKQKVFNNNLKNYNKSWRIIPFFAVAILIIGCLCIDKCSSKEKNVKSNSEFLDNKSLQNVIEKPAKVKKTIGYFNVKKPLNIYRSTGLKI